MRVLRKRGLMKIEKAFTLTEVIITVVIVGVLAIVALPKLVGANEPARAAEAVNTLGILRDAQKIYCLEHECSPNNFPTYDQLEVQVAPNVKYFGVPVCKPNGEIAIARNNGKYTISVAGDSPIFSCTGAGCAQVAKALPYQQPTVVTATEIAAASPGALPGGESGAAGAPSSTSGSGGTPETAAPGALPADESVAAGAPSSTSGSDGTPARIPNPIGWILAEPSECWWLNVPIIQPIFAYFSHEPRMPSTDCHPAPGEKCL